MESSDISDVIQKKKHEQIFNSDGFMLTLSRDHGHFPWFYENFQYKISIEKSKIMVSTCYKYEGVL